MASSLGHPAPRPLLLDRYHFLRRVILLQICTALSYLQTLSAPRLRWGSSDLFVMRCLPKILHVVNWVTSRMYEDRWPPHHPHSGNMWSFLVIAFSCRRVTWIQ